MALVLFNITWMNRYRGQTASDRVYKGGKYVEENETGGEVYNFLPIDGWCYGYVQPPNNTINIQNLGGDPDATNARGVTIVFTATGPSVGNVVVGWYRNARVWRKLQQDHGRIYFARARNAHCTLLPVDERVLTVPRAGRANGQDTWVLGRSNVRHVTEADENQEFVRRLRAYINDPSQIEMPSNGRHRGSLLLHQPDPLKRARVEKLAVECVINFYQGYECQSVERENKGWDLEFRRGAVHLLVEVKGCSGDAAQAELTPNEYRAMLSRRRNYRLAIVTRALDNPQVSVFRFNGSDNTWRDQNFNRLRLRPKLGAIASG